MKKKILIVAAITTVLIIVLIIALGISAFFFLRGSGSETKISTPFKKTESTSAAVKAGQQLSGGKCEGEGSVKLGALPMDEKDFPSLEPYGLMIDAHVTPIDHMYFEPADRDSAIDAYNVYAPADGTIIEIQRRKRDDNLSDVKEEFRLVITYTCTFLSYYDLITVLDPKILKEAKGLEKSDYVQVEISVKSGQLIGKIGKQTLDFAVWDTTKTLKGFVNPDSYNSEPWKIYTVNPFDYFTNDVKKILLTKNLRTAEPIEGKIDYDIDGKLVGNWFVEGTNGYQGANQNKYYEGHLAIVYNHLDPSAIIVSIGDFNGRPEQMTVVGNKPDPAVVGQETGLIKYELVNFEYVRANGQSTQGKYEKNMKVREGKELFGTAVFQLIGKRKLKMETFPGKSAVQVQGFTAKARNYER